MLPIQELFKDLCLVCICVYRSLLCISTNYVCATEGCTYLHLFVVEYI